VGHFNRPARDSHQNDSMCNVREQNVDAPVAAPGNSSMVSPRCLSFAAILLAAPTIRDRQALRGVGGEHSNADVKLPRYSRAISAVCIGFVMWFLDMRQSIGNEEALA
jgi:hypothetical protein